METVCTAAETKICAGEVSVLVVAGAKDAMLSAVCMLLRLASSVRHDCCGTCVSLDLTKVP